MSQIAEWEHAYVRATSDPAVGVRRLELVPERGARQYEPGSHVDVTVYVDGRAHVRSYSLVGEANGDAYIIAVRRMSEGRGGSRYVASLVPGARVEISQPRNLFPLNFEAPSYLLIAGGIGITPLIGMAYPLVRRGADVRMVYAGRNTASMPFLGELSDLLGDRLRVHADDEQGRLDLRRVLEEAAMESEAYVCGPTPMLESFRACWIESGRPPHRMRFESFGSSGHSAPEPFVVRIPRLGVEFVVPSDKSMLETLEDGGVEPLYNCRRGECGLCSVEILERDAPIDHRDVFFSEGEKAASRHMCSCVSRMAGGTVTIDLP